MQIVLSPAKKLDFESKTKTTKYSQPYFTEKTKILIDELRKRTSDDLQAMMKISGNLSRLNAQRYREWSMPFTPENAKQAAMAFNGDVYQALKADELSGEDLDFAQKHLFILSGLHGMLRPLDLIQPYRLEMSSKFKTDNWKNLYDFWGDEITDGFNETGDDVLLNLASPEYFRVVNRNKLNMRIITPVFKELKGDEYRVASIYAKKARGMMARYAIRNRIIDPGELKYFDKGGYRFHESLSDENQWIYTR